MTFGIYPNYLKCYFHIKVCTWLLIAILFIAVPNWKYLPWSSAGECMNKPWHSLTWECYLAFRRREQPIHEDTLRNINNMFLRKRLDWKDCILQLWDILDIQTCGGSKMISARQGLERRKGCLDKIGTLAKSLQGLSAFSMPHLHWLKEAILNNGVNILDALLYTHSKCNSQKWAITLIGWF